jgi:hypothetical protein
MKYLKKGKRFGLKCIAMFLLLTFVGQILHPTAALALTGGPSQPEITQFQQVSASDIVDLFSGDFGYNIPLFEVPGPNGGYPFNLSYQSAPSMDQEAGWVGLGWNINPGSIVRNMRGLPDDFNGQGIKRELDMKPNITAGIGVNVDWEIFSGDGAKAKSTGVTLGLGLKLYYNNYKGIGYTFQPGVSFNLTNKSPNVAVGLGFNFSFDSQDGGIGANLDVSVATNEKKWKASGNGGKFKVGIGYNTNSGVNASYHVQASWNNMKAAQSGSQDFKHNGFGGGSMISFAYPTATPSIGTEMMGTNFTGSVTLGFSPSNTGSDHLYAGFSAFVDAMEIANRYESLPAYGYLNYQNKNNEEALADFNRDKDVVVKEKSTPNLHNPILTYDYYMVNGQGTGGMFRPYRNEVGYIHEQSRMSGSGGGSLGFNIPSDIKKLGINVGFNFSDSRSGRWDEDQNHVSNTGSNLDDYAFFRGKQFSQTNTTDLGYEGPYFKMNGSSSTVDVADFNELGGDDAVRFDINNNTNVVDRELVNKNVGALTTPNSLSANDDIMQERRPRGQLITPFYNSLLIQGSGTHESLAEMDVPYYTSPASGGFYNLAPTGNSLNDLRKITDSEGNNRDSHIGGFAVTNPDGNRYIYGLPAYNLTTREHIYTAVPDAYGTCQTHKEYPGATSIPYKFDGTAATDQYDITDQFKSITTTPAYTHSHLLTSILGTDYVDADGTAGPSDGDYGYWVKFTYVKTTGNSLDDKYQWRTPFTGASYNAGSEASYEDDKVNFTYGKKDIWYVATVETKTHIAVFEISKRKDAIGAATEVNNYHASGSHMDASNEGQQYKLDKIKLYAKGEYITSGSNATPIQTIHFEYDYSLCQGVPNNTKSDNNTGNDQDYNKDVKGGNVAITNDGGKLTLKAVYFTYKNDHTGANHKYKFSYAHNKPYSYIDNKYDRWGTYNWYTDNGQCSNADFPYTNQFPQHPYPTGITGFSFDSIGISNINYDDQIQHFDTKADEAAGAWCLNKIELPSGGSINVEYESDDYSYVQHKEATQMFKITSFGYGDNPTNPYANENNLLYDPDVDITFLNNNELCNRFRKVYFRLEKPILASTSKSDIYKQIYHDYIHPLKRGDQYQVYLNARVNLQGNVWEDIESYYNLDIDPNTILTKMNSITTTFPDDGAWLANDECTSSFPMDLPFGVAQQTTTLTVGTSTGSYYTHGYVMLDNSQIDNFDAAEAAKYNPISVNAWYYMKENLPKILYSIEDLDPGNEDYERIIRGGSLLSIFPQIAAMFRGLPAFCYNANFAYKVDLNRSWIKLATPDGFKYGGGCRVKKLYMQDDSQWAQDSKTDQIGQVYDYTMVESKYNDITRTTVTKTISSGVAAYEPLIGGEENALRYARFYSKNIPLKSASQTYFEGPVNEAYFPAAQVGYRKVTVSSLPTNKLKNAPTATDVAGIQATGVTVNEFYTAKEYPTLVYETDLYIDPYVEAIVPIPFVGTITDKQVVASQGYVVRLNDMHGKPKAVSSYGIGANGVVSNIPTSSVEYYYKSKSLEYEGKNVFEPDNSVEVLSDDPNLRGQFISGENASSEGTNGYEALVENKIMGLDYEFFYDMRQGYTKAGQGGLDFNLDLLGFGIFVCPVPLPWPSYSQSYAKINTIVANKIIHRAAILEKVVATDGQSKVSTQNLVFDPYTGTPLLTVVNNNFNEPVYNYSVPGRFMYSGMDGAYKNSLFEFSATDGITSSASDHTITITGTSNIKNSATGVDIPGDLEGILPFLHEGDEFIVEGPDNTIEKTRAYLLTTISQVDNCHTSGTSVPELRFYIKGSGYLPATSGTEYTFTLVRSGRRNLLANNLGSIVSLNTGSTPFLVNPNDPDPPTALDIILHSPLRNRVKEDLSSSSSSFAYASTLKDWLNSILQPSSGGSFVLPLGLYANSSLAAYPLLADKIEYIIIGPSTNESDGAGCLTCPNYTISGNTVPSGYSITIKIKDEFGGACLYEPCIARTLQQVGGSYSNPALQSFSIETEIGCSISALYGITYETLGTPFLNYDGTNNGVKSYTNTCYNCPTLTNNPFVFKIKNVLQASAYIPLDSWGNADYDKYAKGKKGIWRPSINYYYKDERFQQINTNVILSGDGVFAGKSSGGNKDKMFYLFNWWASAGRPIPVQWLLNNKIVQYNQHGIAIETKDILDIYNATVFDSNGNLPVAIADNTKKQEMLAVNFDNNTLGTLTAYSGIGFTGIKSLAVPGTTTNVVETLAFSNDFKLTENSSYIISAWAGGFNMSKSPKQLDAENPNQMNIKVEFLNSSNTVVGSATSFKTSGFIYEGFFNTYWRRIEGSFTVPTGAAKLKLTFTHRDAAGTGTNQYLSLYGNVDNAAYFDDIRIHPAKSIMKTFVYDNVDFKLKAELDENNYPMYYGYDGSGQLSVVKVLTEDGIKTIKEAYSNTKKQ